MATDASRPRDDDPGHPGHALFPGANAPADVPVDEAVWSAVRHGQTVLGRSGERLGQVREKSTYVFEVEVREGLFRTREVYVPHVAVDRVDGDRVHLKWDKQELIDNYDHFRRYHIADRQPR
jgi:hypothetical protein